MTGRLLRVLRAVPFLFSLILFSLIALAGPAGALRGQDAKPARRQSSPSDEKASPSGDKASPAGEKASAGPEGKQGGPEGRPRETRRTEDLVGRASQELLDLQKRMRVLEKDAAARKARAVDRQRDLGLEKRSLERSVEALKREVEALEKDLAGRREAALTREKELARLQHEVSSLGEPMKGYLLRAEKRVEGGIPWKVEERKVSCRAALDVLARPGTSPAAALAAVGRLQEEEEALARLVETGTVQVEVKGEPLAVPAFHLGLLAVIYASPEGTVLGFALPGQKLEEGILAASFREEAAPGYSQALDVLRRRRTPRVVDLHMPSLPLLVEEAR